MIISLICATFCCFICIIIEKDENLESTSPSQWAYWSRHPKAVLIGQSPAFCITAYTTNVWRCCWYHGFYFLFKPLTPHFPQSLLFSWFSISLIYSLLFTHRSDFLKYHLPACPHHSVQFSSLAQSYPTLCYRMNRSMPGLPVHHQLPEFTQTHVHWVGDAIQPSYPLLSPPPHDPNTSQYQGLFQWVNSSHEVATGLEFQL